jgi:serine/threonine-protein kinase
MSPEQIQGSPNLDGRADLYSLGITLYELVTGRRPFQGDSDYSVMAAHLSQAPVPPIQLDPKVPAALNEVILQSIAKDAAQRFQSAEAFKNALDSVARGLSAAAGMTAPLPLSAIPVQKGHAAIEANVKPGSSKRALYMVAGSVVTLVVLGSLAFQLPRYFMTEAGEPHPVEVQALPQQPQPAPTPDTATTQAQPPDVPAGAPAQQPQVPEKTPAASKPVSTPPRQETSSPAAQAPARPAQPAPQQDQTPVGDLPSTQPPAPRPAVSTAEIEGLAERFNLMATRANTVRTGLKRLEESQARMGLGLRGDVSTAASRMEMFMDQAESALKSVDVPGSKKAMDSAERELERVERVLEGR